MTRARPSVPVVLALLAVAGVWGTSAACSPPRPPLPEPDVSSFAPQAIADIRAVRARLASSASVAARAADSGELGMTYDAYDVPAAAEACYRLASELAPSEARWRYLLGHRLLARGDNAGAAAAFSDAFALAGPRPERVAAALAATDAFLAAGDAAAARGRIDAALSLAPGDSAVRFAEARVLRAEGRERDAAARLLRIVSDVPDAASVHAQLSQALRSLGDAAGADRHAVLSRRPGAVALVPPDPFRDAVHRLNRSATAVRSDGNRLFAAGRYQEAVATFRRAVALGPQDAETRTNLAAALARAGDPAEAETEFREAIRLDPAAVVARFGLAAIFAQQGRDDAAVALYEEALARDPDSLATRYNCACALTRLGRFADAAAHFGRAVALSPKSVDARRGLARALCVERRFGDARRTIEDGLALSPADTALHDDLARILAAADDASVRDGDRALGIARRLSAGGTSPTDTLAMALAESGDFASAAATQRALLAACEASADPPAAAIETMRARLAEYDAGRPCRTPWTVGEARASSGGPSAD